MIDRVIPQLTPPSKPANPQPRSGNANAFSDLLTNATATSGSGMSAPADLASPMNVQVAGGHVFEFHVQRGHGEIEVIALPWGLRSNGELAQSSSAIAVAIPTPYSDVRGATPIQLAARPGAEIAASFPPFGSSLSGPSADMTGVPLLPHVIDAAAFVEEAVTNVTALPPPLALPWLDRLIRWIGQQGHDPEVWVRDYRLDDAAARQIVDAMRSMAQEHGLSIQKIVVNAREVWRKSASSNY
jgi:hypothetical protein